jgi:hypothetical protein
MQQQQKLKHQLQHKLVTQKRLVQQSEEESEKHVEVQV